MELTLECNWIIKYVAYWKINVIALNLLYDGWSNPLVVALLLDYFDSSGIYYVYIQHAVIIAGISKISDKLTVCRLNVVIELI